MTPPRTVVVLGGTGKVGRHVVAGLLDAGIAVRALVRRPPLAGLPPRVVLHRGDVHDPASAAAAADGADAAFLLWPGFSAEGAAPLVTALAQHVRHVVHLSSGVLEPGTNQATPGVWAQVEELVRASGVPATFLRPGGFAANTLMWAPAIRAGRPVRVPYPDGGRSMIHEADVADVAVAALRDPDGHAGQAHLLTGPSILTQRAAAATIGESIGRPVTVEEQSREEAAAQFAGIGAGPGWIAAALDHWASLVEHPEIVLDTVERVTGHPARPFARWVHEHADAFRGPSA